MASLTSQSIAGSYEQLLHVDRDGGGNGTTLVDVKDGDNGTTFALKLAQFHAEIRGTTGTGATGAGKLNLSTAELTVVDNDVLGRIDFLAPLESSGTDAVLAGASIWGEAEDTFAADNNSTALVFATNTSAAATERMRLTSGGSLGIGTNNPTSATGFNSPNLTIHGADPSLVISDSGQDNLQICTHGNAFKFINDSDDRAFFVIEENAPANTLYLDSSGNVGIGTSDPTSDLDIGASGGGDLTLSRTGDSNITDGSNLGVIYFKGHDDSGSNVQPAIGAKIVGQSAGHWDQDDVDDAPTELQFWTCDASGGTSIAQRMVIDEDGNVGIGTTDPTKMLHLQSSTSNEPTIIIENNNDDQHPPRIQFKKNVGADAEADGDLLGHIQFKGQDTGDALHTYASIFGLSTDVTAGEEDGELRFEVTKAGTDANVALSLDANSRISLSNNGGTASNTIFGYQAGNLIHASSANNTFFGHQVADATMTSATADNTGIGYSALGGLLAGSNNTAVGSYAGINITSGTGNTMIGRSAGNAFNSSDVVAVGTSAAGSISNATADGTVAVGKEALYSLTSGARNLAIGYTAGGLITDGHDNTLIGYQSGNQGTYGIVGGTKNTGLGAYSMGASAGAAITGSSNTAIGYNSMLEAQGAVANNTAIGSDSLKNVTTGSSNVAIGEAALDALTTGGSNVAIGRNAGGAMGVAENANILIGFAAGGALDEGTNGSIDDNIAIGLDALVGGDLNTASTAVNRNIAIGTNAMNSTGTNAQTGTIAIGYDALTALTSGAGNTAVGYQALDATTTGNYNTVVGYQAATALPAGANTNTAIGYQSLTAGNNASTDHNTCVGYASGDVITSGHSNTIIGSGADPGGATNTNETVIGYDAEGQGSNTVTLGDTNVTAVYMAEDSGATVHAAGAKYYSNSSAGGSPNVSIYNNNTNNESGALNFYKNANNTHETYDTVAVDDDQSGMINFYITDNNGLEQCASIQARADGDAGVNATPGKLEFYTTPAGAISKTLKLVIAKDGTLTGTDTDGIGSLSDERIKKNIKDYSGGLAIIEKLRPVTFEYKDSSRKQGTQRGFIAQEIKAIDDFFIGEQKLKIDGDNNEHPEYQYVKDTEGVALTSKITGGKDSMYVSAIKELLAKVEILEAKVTALEAK